MTERLNTAVEDGTKAMLVELAGSERKVGALISQLVLDAYEAHTLRESEIQDEAIAAALLDLQRRVRRLEEETDETD